MLETQPSFFTFKGETPPKNNFFNIIKYLAPFKKLAYQLLLLIIIGCAIQFLFPFLTKSVIDKGVNKHDIRFVYLIMIAQLVLHISYASVEIFRNYLILFLGTKINYGLISDFLKKLMVLPIAFFDKKTTGDLLQRINDHQRIEQFFTTSTIEIVFSFFSIIIFGCVLIIYNIKIFIIYCIGSLIFIIWYFAFIKKRRVIEYKKMIQLSHNQNNILQIINGITEIKLNNCSTKKRWEWERKQAKINDLTLTGLRVMQYQNAGGILLNETKNIIVTIVAAIAVINGTMSIGTMLALQYIIGQLNAPIESMARFFQSYQFASISFQRLNEIQTFENDEKPEETIKTLSELSDIKVENLSFKYENTEVLNNINFNIPTNKITAIVGYSGSGKTTLLKLLLGLYQPNQGRILVGDNDLKFCDKNFWRSICGVVMQDGYIFSDTIINNIVLEGTLINESQLKNAITISNLDSYVSKLPLGIYTRIGQDGIGLSQGQKQRILIARAIYKNPLFFFFDEATSALDASNERTIVENLTNVFKNKTVLIIAHRLSTVKNADQIIVLGNGQIAEIGNHSDLIKQQGIYYNLIKDQLELEGKN